MNVEIELFEFLPREGRHEPRQGAGQGLQAEDGAQEKGPQKSCTE